MCENHQQDIGTADTQLPTLERQEAPTPTSSCCGSSPAADPAAHDLDDVAECPVMTGTPVSKARAEAAGLYRDHDGQRYWFCCAACGPLWDADPAEYAAAQA